jgi:hypothetical protein
VPLSFVTLLLVFKVLNSGAGERRNNASKYISAKTSWDLSEKGKFFRGGHRESKIYSGDQSKKGFFW